jgi:hypothetical protein
MIFQTNHLLAANLHGDENKGNGFQGLQNAGVVVSLELWETQACGWWILSLPLGSSLRGGKR